MIPFLRHSGRDKTAGTENRSVVARRQGERLAKRGSRRKSFRVMELFHIMIVLVAAHRYAFAKSTELYAREAEFYCM